jgi:signal transduction histidine kinase
MFPVTGTRLVHVLVILGVVLLVAMFFVAEAGQIRLRETARVITQSQERQAMLSRYLRLLLEAESAKRGFLLTEDPRYLKHFDPAIKRLDELFDLLTASYTDAGLTLELGIARRAEVAAGMRIGEMLGILRLYGEKDLATAIALLNTDIGEKTMNEVRRLMDELRGKEIARVLAATAGWQRDLRTARLLLGLATGISIALLVLAGGFFARDFQRREQLAAEIAERNRHLDQLVQQRTELLSNLSSYLQQMTEKEKASLARELHDELGGLLVATRMDISWLRRHYDNGDAEVAKRWDRVLQSLEAGLNFKRRVIENLRPTLLDNVGLVAALQWLVDEGVRRAGVDCEEEYPESLPELTPDASIAVFRIVQECLMNIMKHARATQVRLGVVSDERQLAVSVRDNGVGIDEQRIGVPRSHGILGMRHRVDAYGGELQIRSLGPGVGTEVAFALPWDRIRHVERDQLAE